MRISLATWCVVLAACVAVDDPPPPSDEGEVTPLFGDRAATYGVFEVGAAWDRDHLSVCWMDGIHDAIHDEDPVMVELRDLGEAIVKRQWNRVGRIRFTETAWPRCSDAPDSDIRIGVEPVTSGLRGRVVAFGSGLQNVPAGQPNMFLAFISTAGQCTGSATAHCPEMTDPDDPPVLVGNDIPNFEHTILHEFGHALGLRHENVHEESSCPPLAGERIDSDTLDGQSIFAFDPDSVMTSCAGDDNNVLSNGDIRALHVLYPGVVSLYNGNDFDFGSAGIRPPIFLGPGHYTSATVAELATTSSIVVPPGYLVQICTAALQCTVATTTRALEAPYTNNLASIRIIPAVLGADRHGYQGTTELFTSSGNAPFAVLADDQMSSVYPAPTMAVMVCSDRGALGDCAGPFIGGGPLDMEAVVLRPGVDDAVSHVTLGNRVVTYSETFSGTSKALGIGVFRASSQSGAFLPAVEALAIWGYDVRACTEEGTPTATTTGGAGDCRVYRQSVDLANQSRPHGPIRFLEIKLPPAGAP